MSYIDQAKGIAQKFKLAPSISLLGVADLKRGLQCRRRLCPPFRFACSPLSHYEIKLPLRHKEPPYMTSANILDIWTPACPHLELVYKVKFTQSPLHHLLLGSSNCGRHMCMVSKNRGMRSSSLLSRENQPGDLRAAATSVFGHFRPKNEPQICGC